MGIVKGGYPDSIGTATCEPLADNSSRRTDRVEAQSRSVALSRGWPFVAGTRLTPNLAQRQHLLHCWLCGEKLERLFRVALSRSVRV